MNIQDAFEETGKVTVKDSNQYAEIHGNSLNLYNAKKVFLRVITINEVLADDWQPYHEKKEIKPENSGELWKLENMFYFTCYDGNGSLEFTDHMESQWIFEGFGGYPIHNQNGWERIHPPVEDEVKNLMDEIEELVKGVEVDDIGTEPAMTKDQFIATVSKLIPFRRGLDLAETFLESFDCYTTFEDECIEKQGK